MSLAERFLLWLRDGYVRGSNWIIASNLDQF